MAKKLIAIIFVFALLIFHVIVALADPVPQLSQTISLVEVVPTNVSFKTRYTMDPQDTWLNFTKTYGPALYIPTSNLSSYFPADSSGKRVAKVSTFTGSPLAQYSRYSETYALPSFDFTFDFCYTSFIYVCELDNSGSTNFSIDDSTITLYKSDGTTQNYSGLLKTYNTSGSIIRFLLEFDCSLVVFSSDITSLSITLDFTTDNSYPQTSNSVTVRTNMFPFIVTSDYEGVELFSAATYSLIQNNILPTIDNISQTMNNMSSAISAQAAQQSQAAAVQMSQAAQQHNDEMAALSSLPRAQAEAQIDAAQSNAAAHVEAEMASEAAARESVSAQIPQYNSSVGGIEDFLNSVNTHLRTASFDFPALILPGMSGVYSGGTLSSSQHFSFDDLFSGQNPIIPPIILTLVQAICSIGLCCFLIRYVQKFVTQILGGTGNEGTV